MEFQPAVARGCRDAALPAERADRGGRVSNCGTFRLHSGQYFLSQALNGEYVAFEEVQDGLCNMVSCTTLLGRFGEPHPPHHRGTFPHGHVATMSPDVLSGISPAVHAQDMRFAAPTEGSHSLVAIERDPFPVRIAQTAFLAHPTRCRAQSPQGAPHLKP